MANGINDRLVKAETLMDLVEKIGGGYLVRSAKNADIAYKVTRPNGHVICTCKDFETNQEDKTYECKHILAVKMAVKNGKVVMKDPTRDIPIIKKSLTDILLEYPFRADQIMKRPGRGGQILDYVDGATVRQRLNDAIGNLSWSSEIISETVVDDEILVKARLTIHNNGQAIRKEAYGGAKIYRDRDGKVIDYGDSFESARTEALKRCAKDMGVGLHLYTGDDQRCSFHSFGHAQDKAKSEDTTYRDGKEGIPREIPQDIEIPTDGAFKRLSNSQLAKLLTLARTKKLEKDDLNAISLELFNVEYPYLTAKDAEALIGHLKEL